MEAVRYGKGSWMQKMLSCCREFGWQEVGAEQVQNMSEAELKGMLESAESEGRMEQGFGDETEVVDVEDDCQVW